MSEGFNLDRNKLIAHAVYTTVELAAIKALGINMVETDVYWVGDNWRVGHPRSWRPAGATEDLESGEWHNVPDHAPTLQEFIDEANKHGLRVLVEIKPSDVEIRNEDAYDKLTAAVRDMHTVISFDTDYLLDLRRSGYNRRLVVLVDSIISTSAVGELAKNDIDIAVGIWRITRRFISIAKEKGLTVFAFTINSRSDAERAQILCGADVPLIANKCNELLSS